jgi:hypothetical protein
MDNAALTKYLKENPRTSISVECSPDHYMAILATVTHAETYVDPTTGVAEDALDAIGNALGGSANA